MDAMDPPHHFLGSRHLARAKHDEPAPTTPRPVGGCPNQQSAHALDLVFGTLWVLHAPRANREDDLLGYDLPRPGPSRPLPTSAGGSQPPLHRPAGSAHPVQRCPSGVVSGGHGCPVAQQIQHSCARGGPCGGGEKRGEPSGSLQLEAGPCLDQSVDRPRLVALGVDVQRGGAAFTASVDTRPAAEDGSHDMSVLSGPVKRGCLHRSQPLAG